MSRLTPKKTRRPWITNKPSHKLSTLRRYQPEFILMFFHTFVMCPINVAHTMLFFVLLRLCASFCVLFSCLSLFCLRQDTFIDPIRTQHLTGSLNPVFFMFFYWDNFVYNPFNHYLFFTLMLYLKSYVQFELFF